MIESKDISVVVQGAIDKKTTIKCLKSIRKHLPKSEIILSTWETSDVNNLKGLYDKLLLNKDPGGIKFSTYVNKENNINRMICSTQSGIAQANNKYILKLRSDMKICNLNFIKNVEDSINRIDKYKVFKKRILAYPYFSLKYHTNYNFKQYQPFHVSDWCYFGLKEDIEKLFNIPLVKEPEFSEYFINQKLNSISIDLFPDTKWQFPPEQYVVLSCAQKNYPEIKMDNRLDVTEDNKLQSEIFLINNFKFIDVEMWGIINLKKDYSMTRLNRNMLIQEGLYSYISYLLDCKKYIDVNITIPKLLLFKDLLRKDYNFIHYKYHFFKLGTLLSELISFVFYALCTLFSIVKIIWVNMQNHNKGSIVIQSLINKKESKKIQEIICRDK